MRDIVRKIVVLAVVAFASLAAHAQKNDTVPYVMIDGLKVPLLEKQYVATDNFQDNWFVSLYTGVTSNWGSDCSHAGFFQLMGPAAAIAAGKEITPISSFRVQINYNRNTGVTDDQFGVVNGVDYSYLKHDRFKWHSAGLHFEYMLNFTNLLLGFRENRKFYFQGIVGIGGSVSRGYQTEQYVQAQQVDNSYGHQLENEDKYDSRQHSLVALRAGVAATFMVGRNWNLHIEAMENILDNSFDSNPTTTNVWDGHLDVMVGVSYRFNNKGGAAPGFYYPRHDMEVYKRQYARLEDLRDRTRKRQKELEEMTDTIDVDAQVMYTLIAFDEGEATVDRLQQTNIYTTAYAWAKNTRSYIYIVNSTGRDDRLFHKRAEAIRDILLERYEIPAAVIKVVPNEKDIKPVGDYIEFIVND